jgi:uncharacterized protein YpmB
MKNVKTKEQLRQESAVASLAGYEDISIPGMEPATAKPLVSTPIMAEEKKGKQLIVEVPINSANRLKVKCAQLGISQSRGLQALIEGWINDEIDVDISRPVRPIRTRNGKLDLKNQKS